ncbi:MAG: ATP-binding protein [Candidatus Kryptonium sp.]
MNYKSLKFRLNLWYLFVFTITVLLAEIGIYIYLDKSLHKEIDILLHREAKELIENLRFDANGLSFVDSTEFYEVKHLYLNEASVFFRVFDKDLNLVAISENLKRADFLIPNPNKEKFGCTDEVLINGKRLRIFHHPIYFNGEFHGIVETARFEGTVQTAMGFLRTSIIIAIVLALLIASYGGNLIVSKLISPLEQVIERADKITAENLTDRIVLNNSKYPDEIVKLVNTLNKLLERLEKSFNQISQFTSDVAHELLTPLTVIKDEIEVTLIKKRRSNEYINTLNSIQRQTDRAISIIKSMLYLAKADAGIVKANFDRICVSDLIRELVLLFNFKAKQKNVKIKFDCSNNIFLTTDDRLLFEALKNIIDNAIEYTNSGGEVEIICEHEKGKVKISISDTGIGISEDDLPRIFDRFYRGKNAFEINPSGTGLGLSLTKAIIDILSGEIEVYSQLGKGTKFIIYLPDRA